MVRFANPAKISMIMPKTERYDQLAGLGVRESMKNEVAAMSTMGKAQQTGLSTVARDVAADKMRAAGMFGQGQSTARTAIGAASGLGSSLLGGIDFGAGAGGGGLGIADSSAFDLNQNFFSGGAGPSFDAGFSWNPIGQY